MTSTSVNWARNFRHAGTGFSAASSFLPYRSSRCARLLLAQAGPRIRVERGQYLVDGLPMRLHPGWPNGIVAH